MLGLIAASLLLGPVSDHGFHPANHLYVTAPPVTRPPQFPRCQRRSLCKRGGDPGLVQSGLAATCTGSSGNLALSRRTTRHQPPNKLVAKLTPGCLAANIWQPCASGTRSWHSGKTPQPPAHIYLYGVGNSYFISSSSSYLLH